MKVGYIRVSTAEQNTARQKVLMQELGVTKVYIDHMSGKDTKRPELTALLEFVREGDTVVVESISRFARNTRDLLELTDKLTSKGVDFVSRKEAIDTTTPSGKFMLTIFGAVAELEREYILQRQKEGIAIAKANGVYKGRKTVAHEGKHHRRKHSHKVNDDDQLHSNPRSLPLGILNGQQSDNTRRIGKFQG